MALAEKNSYHFNNDIWFISSNDVLMTLDIMKDLFANNMINSTLCQNKDGKKCGSIHYNEGIEIP